MKKQDPGIPPSPESIATMKDFTRKIVTVSKAEVLEREKAYRKRKSRTAKA